MSTALISLTMSLPSLTPRAVLLDCDGVILPGTEELWARVSRAALMDLTDGRWNEVHQAAIVGESRVGIWRYLVKNFGLTIDFEEFKRQNQELADIVYNEATLAPGLPDALKIRRSEGLKTGIVTNGMRAWLDTTMRRFHLENLLDGTICIDDSDELEGKPKPDLYIEGAKRIGVSPEECIAFEDSDLGVQAAVAARMHVIGVDNGHNNINAIRDQVSRVITTAQLADALWQPNPNIGA